MQELSTQLGRNWSEVTAAFEKQLARAAPLLEKFSDGLAHATAGYITDAGDAVASVWKNPLRALGSAASAFMDLGPGGPISQWAAGQLAEFLKVSAAPPVASALLGAKNWALPDFASITATPQSYKAYLARRDTVAGLPAGLLEAVWNTESSERLFPGMSKAGAIGAFQLMPDTAKDFSANPWNPVDSANAASLYLKQLMGEFHDLDKALAAYDWGPGNLEKLLKLHPKDWESYLPQETKNYITKTEQSMRFPTITVKVNAPPGFNASVAGSQLAQ